MIKLPRNDLLIKKARIVAQEEDYNDDDYGIKTSYFLEALQDASDWIHLHLVNEKCQPFVAYKDYDISSETERIAVPSDIFIDHMVYQVCYSPTGTDGTFDEPMRLMYERANPIAAGYPDEYLVEGGYIYFNALVSAGTYRVRYEKAIDRMEIRRGVISAVTGTAPAVTTITIDVSDSTFVEDDWDDVPEYLTIVDRDGEVLMRNIPVDSFDSATGVITLDSGFEAEDGETRPVGSWVCFGPSSTTHSKLPAVAQSFFKEYMKAYAQEGRSSDDIVSSNPRMMSFLDQLTEAYGQLPSGFATIPGGGY